LQHLDEDTKRPLEITQVRVDGSPVPLLQYFRLVPAYASDTRRCFQLVFFGDKLGEVLKKRDEGSGARLLDDLKKLNVSSAFLKELSKFDPKQATFINDVLELARKVSCHEGPELYDKVARLVSKLFDTPEHKLYSAIIHEHSIALRIERNPQ